MIRKILFRSFNLTNKIKYFFLNRLTPAGLLFLIGLAATALVGLDTNRNKAYQAFTFLASIFLISLISTFFFRARFSAHRLLPRFGTAGLPLTYRVEIINQSSKKQKGLLIIEKPMVQKPTFEEFMQSREPYEARRNRFDRAVRYHRWQWLMQLKKGPNMKEQPVSDLGAGSKADIRMEMTPLRRGRLYLSALNVNRSDPFGLIKSIFTVPVSDSILILPKRYPLPPIDLPGIRKHQPGGVALASSIGEAEEFVSLRDYQPGDPLRRIHWKSWAKAGKPIVKEYQEEFFVRHALILDTFHQIPGNETFEEAVSLAASMVSNIPTGETMLDLMFIGQEAYCFTTGRGLSNTDKMLEILASVTTCTDKEFSSLYPLVLAQAGQLSSCLCVLLSWDEERQSLIRNLKRFGLPVKVFVITERDVPAGLDPGLMRDDRHNFHQLEAGKIQEGLDRL